MNRCMEMDHQWPGRDGTPRRPRVGMYPNGCPTRTGKPNIQQGLSNKDRQAKGTQENATRTGKPNEDRQAEGQAEAPHPADQMVRRWRTCRAVRRSAGSPSQRFVALLETFFAAGCLVATFFVATFLVAALLVADFATVFPAFTLLVFFASFFPSGPRPVLASDFT